MSTKFRSPLFDVFDKMFEIQGGYGNQTKVEKNENGYVVKLSVPGLTKDDLKITVIDGILRISYEKEGGSTFVDKFTKSYSLPEDVDQNNIEGKVEHGVLHILLPITKKKPVEKSIPIS